MAYRGGRLLVALPLVGAACSLSNLDGFTGGATPTLDGGPREASTPPGSRDAGGDAQPVVRDEAGTPSADPYGDAVRADAPTSWWRFEDPPGSHTLHDEMNAHDGQVLPRDSNPVAIQFGVLGAVGKAAHVGNSAGYFNVGDVFDFAGLVPFTLEAWVQNDAPAEEYEAIFSKRSEISGAPDSGWVVFLHKGDRGLGYQFWKSGAVSASTNTTLPNGFHHFAITATKRADSVEYVLFVDGAPVSNDPNKTDQQLDTQTSLALGFGWNGALDEMAIYEHALTPERVAAHYKAVNP